MLSLRRAPCAPLRPLLRAVWAYDAEPQGGSIERVLPTGRVQLTIRLSRDPMTIYADENGNAPRAVGHSVVGGPHSSFYVRSVAESVSSVGVCLVHGAAPLLFGVSARELAEGHTSLDDIWGSEASLLRERLAEIPSPKDRMLALESFLAEKFTRAREVRPVVVDAIARFRMGESVARVVDRSGYSHRGFLDIFRDAVGLTPKAFSRVARARRALALAKSRTLADVAAEAGYADQAHFTREVTAVAGVSPGTYMKLCPSGSHHVPIR